MPSVRSRPKVGLALALLPRVPLVPPTRAPSGLREPLARRQRLVALARLLKVDSVLRQQRQRLDSRLQGRLGSKEVCIHGFARLPYAFSMHSTTLQAGCMLHWT